MQRTSYAKMNCPVARSLERIGDWWTVLILRDAFYGMTRFDQFQTSLGIAPNMLTRRLKTLVEDGLLERRLYEEKPPRYEYVLTKVGRDFHIVLLALLDWGNRHFAPTGPTVQIVSTDDQRPVRPVMVDAKTGERIRGESFALAPGPGANEQMKRRLQVHGRAPFGGPVQDAAPPASKKPPRRAAK